MWHVKFNTGTDSVRPHAVVSTDAETVATYKLVHYYPPAQWRLVDTRFTGDEAAVINRRGKVS